MCHSLEKIGSASVCFLLVRDVLLLLCAVDPPLIRRRRSSPSIYKKVNELTESMSGEREKEKEKDVIHGDKIENRASSLPAKHRTAPEEEKAGGGDGDTVCKVPIEISNKCAQCHQEIILVLISVRPAPAYRHAHHPCLRSLGRISDLWRRYLFVFTIENRRTST